MPKINLREAVQNVRKYIVEFNDILGVNIKDVLIEETELSEDEQFWLITIGFDREVDPNKKKIYVNSQAVADLFPQVKTFTVERVYKTFKVDSSTGEVISMKIYKL